MPVKAHKALVKSANKKGLTGSRKRAFIFGTLKRIKKK